MKIRYIPGTFIVKGECSREPEPATDLEMTGSFAERLRKWRKFRKFNQSQLGLRCQISRATISHYECGYYVPRIEGRLRIAAVLGTDDALRRECKGTRRF